MTPSSHTDLYLTSLRYFRRRIEVAECSAGKTRGDASKVRVITYFSLYSDNDQCEGFTILTDGRGLQGGLPLRHHNRDTDRTLLRRRVRTVLVPRCAHGRHQADPDGRVRCPRVQHGRHVRRRGILCRHEWGRYNLYILTIITYMY